MYKKLPLTLSLLVAGSMVFGACKSQGESVSYNLPSRDYNTESEIVYLKEAVDVIDAEIDKRPNISSIEKRRYSFISIASDENKPYDQPETLEEACVDSDLSIVLFGDSITQGHLMYGNLLELDFNENFDSEIEVYINGLRGLRADNQTSIDVFNSEILKTSKDV